MKHVSIETDDGVAVIRYANAPRNYLCQTGCDELLEAFATVSEDDAVRVVVFTGDAPDRYIRHFDIAQIITVGEMVAAGKIGVEVMKAGAFGRPMAGVAACPKPVIAAITGPCMGGGLEFSLACDLRVVSEHVTEIGMPEVRVGICGGTQRLPLVVGQGHALDLVLTGRVVDAAEAVRIGLVREAAPDALARAREIAVDMARSLPEVLQACKQAVRSATEAELSYDFEHEAFIRLLRDGGSLDNLKRFAAVDMDLDRL